MQAVVTQAWGGVSASGGFDIGAYGWTGGLYGASWGAQLEAAGVDFSATFGGFWGGLKGAVKGHGEAAQFAGQLAGTPYGRGAMAGAALGLTFSTMNFLSGNPGAMYGLAVHGMNLGLFSGQAPTSAPEGDMGFDGPGGFPSDHALVSAARTLGISEEELGPVKPVQAGVPYEQTKEYLGAQERIGSLQTMIAKLGADLEAIEKRKAELAPKRRYTAGRIPLVHTELGSPEPKALGAEGRERMLMAHKTAGRRP